MRRYGRPFQPDSLSGRIRALKAGESVFFARSQSHVSALVHAQTDRGYAPAGARYVTRKEGLGTRVERVR